MSEQIPTRTVYKYPFTVESTIAKLRLPEGAQILRCDWQSDTLQCWAMVDASRPKTERLIAVCGTGQSLPPGNLRFINTAMEQDGAYVFHFFELNDFGGRR